MGLEFEAFEWMFCRSREKGKKKKVQNQVENVGKVKEEGRTLKGYFGHVIKCAIFYAPLTL